jgi:hypothetical protein
MAGLIALGIRHAIKYDLFADLHKKAKQHQCNFADTL